jgi:hypothetical protein
MNKMILSTLACAALCGLAGPAMADAECQAGSAYGYKPGCGGPSFGGQEYNPPTILQNTPPQQPYANQPYYYPPVANARPHYPYVVPNAPVFQPSRRDRDGDGVVNWRDRHPDDPYRQ